MDEIAKSLSGQYGVIFLAVAISIAGFMGHWVFGWVHKAVIVEKDKQLQEVNNRAERWEAIALKALQVGEKVIGVKEKE